MFRYLNLFEAVLFSFASGLLTHFAFPAANQFYLAFFSLVPFLISIAHASYARAFLMGFIYAVTFHALQMGWVTYFHKAAYPALLVALGVQYGLTSLVFRFLSTRFPLARSVLIPLVFTSFEYLRTLGFLKFSYGNLGYALSSWTTFIQFSDLTGHLGVSFVLYFINALLADFVMNKKKWPPYASPKDWLCNRFVLILCLLTVILTYGTLRLNAPPKKLDKVAIALIQPWFDFNEPWNTRNKKKVFQKLTHLSEKARIYRPDLIVWPESALFTYYDNYLKINHPEALQYQEWFRQFLARSPSTDLLVGSLSYESPNDFQSKNTKSAKGAKTAAATKSRKIYNTLFLLDSQGRVKQSYAKRLLVPFAEWFPYEKYFPFLNPILRAAQASQFTPGKNMTLFKHPRFRYSGLICYEDVFGDFCRRFVKKGANFLVVVTNDAWSYTPVSERLHNSLSIFRAIENRRPVIRAANAGVTCAIDSRGRILKQIPLFKEGILIEEIHLSAEESLYTRFGDGLFILLSLVVLTLLGVCMFKKPSEQIINVK